MVRILAVMGCVMALSAYAPVQTHAAGTFEAAPSRPDTELLQAEQAVKAKDWTKAIAILEPYLAKNPRSADGFNFLGYSYRKSGDRQKALTYYTRALDIEPNHLGANEYLGELYLEMNDLPKAEQRLEVLARACRARCEEYRDLKGGIEKFKAAKPRS